MTISGHSDGNVDHDLCLNPTIQEKTDTDEEISSFLLLMLQRARVMERAIGHGKCSSSQTFSCWCTAFILQWSWILVCRVWSYEEVENSDGLVVFFIADQLIADL